MTITTENIRTLDFADGGEPFCPIGIVGVSFLTLDWVFGGEPFYAVSISSPSAVQPRMWISA
jgi:hypothetical protein